jgi:hypothetical protein
MQKALNLILIPLLPIFNQNYASVYRSYYYNVKKILGINLSDGDYSRLPSLNSNH